MTNLDPLLQEDLMAEELLSERRQSRDRRTGEFDDYWLHWNPERRKGDRRHRASAQPLGDATAVPSSFLQAFRRLFS
jgi:hypothetical protein